ncbi:MAG TPA: preprotein translocase subunit YajC [Jiangellales bacterium]|nr:preprotein translocase subunit YajC [Jiangellales bacterium]
MEALLLPLLLLAVFYLLLIRPQQRQRKQMAELQSSLVPGAKVMTGAGLFGTVVSIHDERVELEVAPGVTNWYLRRAIVQIFPDEPAGPTFNESSAESVQPGDNDKPDGDSR